MLRAEVESRTQGSRPRTQKNFVAKAKDRVSRGQGEGPRTETQVLSKKKKVLKNFFQAISKKGLQKFFSGNLYLRNQKKGLCRFFAKFLAFSTETYRNIQPALLSLNCDLNTPQYINTGIV